MDLEPKQTYFVYYVVAALYSSVVMLCFLSMYKLASHNLGMDLKMNVGEV
jgi:hypothetical protein